MQIRKHLNFKIKFIIESREEQIEPFISCTFQSIIYCIRTSTSLDAWQIDHREPNRAQTPFFQFDSFELEISRVNYCAIVLEKNIKNILKLSKLFG